MTTRILYQNAFTEGGELRKTDQVLAKIQIIERLIAIRARIQQFIGSCKSRLLLNPEEANYLAALSPEAASIIAEIQQIAWYIKIHDLQDGILVEDNDVTFYPCDGMMQVGSENQPSFSNSVSDAFFYCTGTQLSLLTTGTERTRYVKTRVQRDSNMWLRSLGVYSLVDNMRIRDGVEIPIRFTWLLDAIINSVAVLKENPDGEAFPPLRVRYTTKLYRQTISISLLPAVSTWPELSAFLHYPMAQGSSTILVDCNTLELALFTLECFFSDSRAVQGLKCELAKLEIARDHVKKVTSIISEDMSDKQKDNANWNTFIESSQFSSYFSSNDRMMSFINDLGISKPE